MAKKTPPKMSKELILSLKKNNTWQPVQDYIWGSKFFKTIVKYALDWRYANIEKNLVDWSQEVCESIPIQISKDLYAMQNLNKTDFLALQCLEYVAKNIRYISDSKVWKVSEKWQTPAETWKLKTGDCEDGAILLYAIMRYVGFSDDQVWIVAGDVDGGGHCYVVYKADDGEEYPLDWCYWYDKSIMMDVIYDNRPEYYYGDREWFRFNTSGGYKEV